MKNPNCTHKQLRAVASQFSFEDWGWLCTKGEFLDATEAKSPEEIEGLAEVMLAERDAQPNA